MIAGCYDSDADTETFPTHTHRNLSATYHAVIMHPFTVVTHPFTRSQIAPIYTVTVHPLTNTSHIILIFIVAL